MVMFEFLTDSRKMAYRDLYVNAYGSHYEVAKRSKNIKKIQTLYFGQPQCFLHHENIIVSTIEEFFIQT